MNLSEIDSNSNLPLFRPLTFHPSNSSYTLRSGKISYTRCREILRDCLSKLGYNPNNFGLSVGREILRDCLSKLGYNPNNFGLHSLRSGGITSVVRNSGHSISERLLKIHGRWKSDSAKDMYIEESLENRLQVTMYLRL